MTPRARRRARPGAGALWLVGGVLLATMLFHAARCSSPQPGHRPVSLRNRRVRRDGLAALLSGALLLPALDLRG